MPGDFSFAGFDRNSRRVFLALVEKHSDLATIVPPEDGPFVAFVGGDARAVPIDELLSMTEGLLNRGAVYFVIWGDDCERVEAIVHDAISVRERGPESPEVITSSHPDESLEVALAFATTFAVPDQGLEAALLLVVIVGRAKEHEQARGCLAELLEDDPPVAEG